MFTSKGLGPQGEQQTHGAKMRPDMMIVEMTTAEQQQYMRHDDHSGSRLTPLTPVMPDGNPGGGRSMNIVEGDIALIQDMREICKKREHSIKHWRKLSRTTATMLPLSLLSKDNLGHHITLHLTL